MTMSLAQGTYCNRKQLDPEDPRCAHIILTGHVTKVEANSTEEAFARDALFKRHPDMPGWPTGKKNEKKRFQSCRIASTVGDIPNYCVFPYLGFFGTTENKMTSRAEYQVPWGRTYFPIEKFHNFRALRLSFTISEHHTVMSIDISE